MNTCNQLSCFWRYCAAILIGRNNGLVHPSPICSSLRNEKKNRKSRTGSNVLQGRNIWCASFRLSRSTARVGVGLWSCRQWLHSMSARGRYIFLVQLVVYVFLLSSMACRSWCLINLFGYSFTHSFIRVSAIVFDCWCSFVMHGFILCRLQF